MELEITLSKINQKEKRQILNVFIHLWTIKKKKEQMKLNLN